MESINEQHPIIRLSKKDQTTLYLIREELKARKLFRMLEKIGVCESEYEPHLDCVILRRLGLDSSDETFEAYDVLMERRVKKVKKRGDLVKHALRVYAELLAIGKSRATPD